MTDKDRELMQQALETLDYEAERGNDDGYRQLRDALRERLAEQPAQQWNAGVPSLYPEPEQGVSIKVKYEQPEFFTHCVDQPYDWSEWVCPDPKGYLMKCCDCGLVHEAEFGVVRYKSEAEREDCEPVDDPNLQAVFRMRRSEQWSPADMAHRAGGLTMEQPAQQQEPEPDRVKFERHWRKTRGDKKANRELPRHPLQPQTYIQDSANRHWVTWQAAVRSVAPPASKPLTDEEIESINVRFVGRRDLARLFARAIEAAHGIKGEA